MRRNNKIASLIMSVALITCAGSFGSLAAATGVSAIDFSAYNTASIPGTGSGVSNASSAAGTSGLPAQSVQAAQMTQQSGSSYDESINAQFRLGTYTASTGAVIIGPVSAIDTSSLSAAQTTALDQYFQNSVIVGNSIGNGFALYTKKHTDDPVLKNFQSLTANGFYIEGAFEDISTSSRHPFYMGQQRYVWDSIQLMGAKHVFLSFGTTEVQFPSVLDDYQKLINQIKTVNPDVDITVISATYIYPGKYYGTMTSANVKSFNQSMEQICAANGWSFINVADRLADANGDLDPVYSSDEYIHQNDQAYDIWTAALKEYGLKKLGMA